MEQLDGIKPQDSSQDINKEFLKFQRGLSIKKLEELLQLGIDLNNLFLLEYAFLGVDIAGDTKSSKIMGWEQTLFRKGYLDGEGKITPKGIDLIRNLLENNDILPTKKEKGTKEEWFDKWWKAYPGTDTFEYKGKSFRGSRALRVDKEKCKIKFNKILSTGEYKPQDLIDALIYEVNQKKENSFKEGSNKLKYMQNSLTYLNQCTYDPYIELAKNSNLIQKVEGTDKKTNSFSI